MKASFENKEALQEFAASMLNQEKFVLVCSKHRYTYGKTSKPNFKCKECMMVSFVGLLCNTPPEKMRETVEMLEYSVHKLIEADEKGLIDHKTLYKHPKITIEQEDGNIIKYNEGKD